MYLVKFYKRVQIVIADLWGCFQGQLYGNFHDIDEVTMFADYRVPQILHDIGCIKYSDDLRVALDNHEMLKNGDIREMEIRGTGIWSVELIRRKIHDLIINDENEHGNDMKSCVNSIVIDFYLWDTAKLVQFQNKSGKSICHQTRSIYY